MSYELKIDPKRRAAGRLLNKAHKLIVEAAIEEKRVNGLSQSQAAEVIGVNKSVLNRILRGRTNITLRTLAEIAWALGREPILEFRDVRPTKAANIIHPQPARVTNISSGSQVTIRSDKTETRSRSLEKLQA